MLRRLLTLLAVITGLAASGAQAEMRVSGLNQVQLEAAVSQASACQTSGYSDQLIVQPRKKQPAEAQSECPRSVVTVVIPTVMFGPDRAHE